MLQKVSLYNGVAVNNASFSDVHHNFISLIEQGGYSVAINADKLWMYDKNIIGDELKDAAFNVADGASAVILAKLVDPDCVVEKINFPKLAIDVCIDQNHPIFILGATPDNNQRAIDKISTEIGSDSNVDGIHGYHTDEEFEVALCNWSSELDSGLVLLGLGSPKQEVLAKKLSPRFPNLFFLCCGGAINIMAGGLDDIPRAVKNSKYEWLYRFAREPRARLHRLPRYVYIFFVISGIKIRRFLRFRR